MSMYESGIKHEKNDNQLNQKPVSFPLWIVLIFYYLIFISAIDVFNNIRALVQVLQSTSTMQIVVEMNRESLGWYASSLFVRLTAVASLYFLIFKKIKVMAIYNIAVSVSLLYFIFSASLGSYSIDGGIKEFIDYSSSRYYIDGLTIIPYILDSYIPYDYFSSISKLTAMKGFASLNIIFPLLYIIILVLRASKDHSD